MYNQYLDNNDFVVLDPAPAPEAPHQERTGPSRPSQPTPGHRPPSDLLSDAVGGVSQLLGGVLKHFSLEKFDTGDILLVLIILFLFLEGDNLEVVITLGLMLLLGLGDD